MKPLKFLYPALLLIYSCTKNDIPDNTNSQTGQSGKVKTVTYSTDDVSFGTTTTYYYYNSDGTLNNTKVGDGTTFNNPTTYTYVYTSNTITITAINTLSQTTYVQEAYKDGNGRTDSLVSYYEPNRSNLSAEKLTFNSSGIPIGIKWYDFENGTTPNSPSQIWDFTVSGRDIIKREDKPTEPNMIFGSFFTYDYYPNVNNLTPEAFGVPYSHIFFSNFTSFTIPSFFSDSHLLKAERATSYDNIGTSTIDNSWEYTFDSKNRIETEIMLSHYNGIPDGHYNKLAYTYY